MERWNDSEILRFLELFELQPCLWNADLPQYRSPDKRSEAIRWIIEKLGSRMTEMEIRCKIKNIRTTYVKCLKRVLRAEELGLAETFMPTLLWFKRADVFLRTHSERTLIKKKQKKNLETMLSNNLVSTFKFENDLHDSDSEAEIVAAETECEDEENRTTTNFNDNSTDETNPPVTKNPTHRPTQLQLETSESEEDKVVESKFRKTDKRVSHTSSNRSNSSRHLEQQEEDSSKDRRDLSNASYHRRHDSYANPGPDVRRGRHSSEVHRKSEEADERFPKKRRRLPDYLEEDEFDVFTKHVGNQLRQLPLERALRCQDGIHSLLMKERIDYCQEQAAQCKARNEVVQMAPEVINVSSLNFSIED